MKIIMLTGDSNKGKTATLHFVLEILIVYGAKTTVVEHIGSDNQRDFSSILEYKGETIRIFSMGDLENPLGKALSDTKYDFFICACNNVFKKTLQRANHLFEKTVADTDASRLSANWYDANKIIETL